MTPTVTTSAKVPDALQTNVEGLKWFKIYHEGYDASAGLWATQKLIEKKGKVSFKVPTCIESGQYLMRAEVIGRPVLIVHLEPCSPNLATMTALHAASYNSGAQFFVSPYLV